ncbi:hypothetical protein ACIQ2D_14375 [Lysinibacillus sp. NPDC097287]|uniref:hypothetical protein n=1 Tax=Lysinibacillus sp. NPDC097287 TaxID=3364144 RepID=UPI0037F489BC
MQQSNLSERNAFCRFFLGTSMTAFGIAKVSRNPDCTSGKLMIALGAMKMAEGIFKYCPTKAMLSTNMQSAMSTTMQSMLSGQNSMTSDDVNKLMKDFSAAFSSNANENKPATTKTNDATEKKQNTSDNTNSTNKTQNPS